MHYNIFCCGNAQNVYFVLILVNPADSGRLYNIIICGHKIVYTTTLRYILSRCPCVGEKEKFTMLYNVARMFVYTGRM